MPPTTSTSLTERERLREEFRREWTPERFYPMDSRLMGRILHRPIESARVAFQDASEDDLRRLVHFARKGEILPPTEEPDADAWEEVLRASKE